MGEIMYKSIVITSAKWYKSAVRKYFNEGYEIVWNIHVPINHVYIIDNEGTITTVVQTDL
jgi:hypothetical protein